jgi:hypothetical protein
MVSFSPTGMLKEAMILKDELELAMDVGVDVV